MNRQKVISSNISSIGYEENSSMLEIQFQNGGVYQYFNVSKSLFSRLMNATSHGTFFDRYIKKGGFRFKKIH